MTARTTIHQHSHVYLFKPVDCFITTHPQTLYIWLKPTEVTDVIVTSSISTTTVKPYAINVDEVAEAYYDQHYSGTAFPATITKPYQRVSFSYYFTDRPFAILNISYTYSYTCPSEIETFITSKLNQSVSHADIIELLEQKSFLEADIQNWIDAIEAGTTVVSTGTTNFDWPIEQMITPKWNNN